MRIESLGKINQVYRTDNVKKKSGTVSEKSRDSLEISQMGKVFHLAKKAVQAAPDIRQDKVDQIRQQMANGTYSVTGREIADKLVDYYFDYKA